MSDSSIKDQAVCLHSRDYSDSSQIITLFGRASGKVSAIAKGSRRPGSKAFDGRIDPLGRAWVVFTPPRPERSLVTLISYDPVASHRALRGDLKSLYTALLCAQLTSEFTEPFDPHPALFTSLCRILSDMERGNDPLSLLLSFVTVLLTQVGIAPDWTHCAQCRRSPDPAGDIYFSPQRGGILCRDCESAFPDKHRVSHAVLELLSQSHFESSFPAAQRFAAWDLLAYHIRWTLGKEPRTLAFVSKLLKT